MNREIPERPEELPDPLYPNETPFIPDSYEPEVPDYPEPEPSTQPEPNGK